MPGTMDDLKARVKDLGMSDPMAQIGSAMTRIGGSLQEGYRQARKVIDPYLPTTKRKPTSGRSVTSRR